MTFVRPTGFYTTYFVDREKRNPYEMLKHFLFDGSSGRTDVLIVGERNAYFEDRNNAADLVGGLADGIAKAILYSPNLSSTRTLYGTPIYWGNHYCPPKTGFNPLTQDWKNNTDAGNPDGIGRCLLGTRYGSESYFYSQNNINSKITLPCTSISGEDGNSIFLDNAVQEPPSSRIAYLYSGTAQASGVLFTAPTFATAPISSNNIYTSFLNQGPNGYPVFLGSRNKSTLPMSAIKRFPVGSYDINTNIITEHLIDETTRTEMRGAIALAQGTAYPSSALLNVGLNVDTLVTTDPRFEKTQGIINFGISASNFLINLLKDKGWSVCTSGCTGNEDAYISSSFGETGDGTPINYFIMNRNLPNNLAATGSQWAFTPESLSILHGNIRRQITSDIHFANFGNLYKANQRGLPPFTQYSQTTNHVSIGTEFPYKIFIEPDVDNTNNIFKEQKYTPALSGYAGPFVWNDTRDTPNTTFYKDKKIICHSNLGKIFTSYTTTPELAITTTTAPSSSSLYTTTNFSYFVTYFKIQTEDESANKKAYPSGILPITISKWNAGTSSWNLITTNTQDTTNAVITNPGNPDSLRLFYETNVNLSLHSSTKYALSFTGFNTASGSTRLSGNHIITTHWGEDKNNLNGISFTHLYMTQDLRTGDVTYAWQTTPSFQVRAQVREIFEAVKKRQANQARKKVIVLYHGLRWDSATPGEGYLSGWSQSYLQNVHDTIAQAGKGAGFTPDEIVVWFVGPLPGPKVDYFPDDTLNNSPTANLDNFIKVKFVFVGGISTNPLGGLFKPTIAFTNTSSFFQGWTALTWPNPIPIGNNFCYNGVFTSCDEISSLTTLRNKLASSSTSRSTYSLDAGEESFFHTPSTDSYLMLGDLLLQAVDSNVSAAYFAPHWVLDYGRQLGYTEDPVSLAPFEFVTPTFDTTELNPYLVSYDAICDNPANAKNIQAKETLSKFKTKMLQ